MPGRVCHVKQLVFICNDVRTSVYDCEIRRSKTFTKNVAELSSPLGIVAANVITLVIDCISYAVLLIVGLPTRSLV